MRFSCLLMHTASWPKPAFQVPTFMPGCSSGLLSRRDTITRALFIEVCRMFTSGMPLSIISIAWASCSVVAWLWFFCMRCMAD